MKKVVLITNIPNPYRVPLFNELNSQLKKENIHLKIIFATKTYKRRLFQLDEKEFNFDYSYLNNEAITIGGNAENAYFSYKGLKRVLKIEQPDLIIVSGFSSATLKVFSFSLFHKTPYLIWNGSIEKKGRKDSIIRTFQRKLLTRFAKGFIAYGTKAKSYLVGLGAHPSKVFIAINTVDTSFYDIETSKLRATTYNDGVHHFIYLGYLVPRKNVGLLIDIAYLLKQQRSDFCIDIIGDGESKAKLESKVQELNLCDQIKFHGFKQKNELPIYFANTEALLFQTDFDIWGLVLNEAMAAGLPCLSSIHAGASTDLIEDRINGFIVDYENKEQVVEKINFIIENPKKAEELGVNARDFIRKNASLSVSANGFVKAINATLRLFV
ncbi:MAG: glycosyltransferase family 4 protein [Bacteroidota bacterium]